MHHTFSYVFHTPTGKYHTPVATAAEAVHRMLAGNTMPLGVGSLASVCVRPQRTRQAGESIQAPNRRNHAFVGDWLNSHPHPSNRVVGLVRTRSSNSQASFAESQAFIKRIEAGV